MRKCSGCLVTKDDSEFHRRKNGRDGLQSRCKKCTAVESKAWRIANPVRHRKNRTSQRDRNRDKINAQNSDYWHNRRSAELKQIDREKSAEMYRTLRLSVLVHLGMKCARCGFADSRALQVDHIFSDGAAERQNLGNQTILKLVLKTVPGERYQCVCANCNWILRHERGEHRARKAG